ncbi:MAG: acyltransferase [Deltaproteobacteria bacterium]|nr:acyltransferase [Deltaproteobacteria bacterium]
MPPSITPVLARIRRGLWKQADAQDELRRQYFVIDLTRGVAALAVLAWHFTLFFAPAAAPGPAAPDKAFFPFSSLLWPFYAYGDRAVPYFWLISGFVFAHAYPTRSITTRAFVVNRLARLYPLHLATLLLVAGLQALHAVRSGAHQAYGNNDAYHFVLHLLFASSWGFETGFSFNGPVWSVSVEMLVYAGYWLLLPVIARLGAPSSAGFAALCYAAMAGGVTHAAAMCGAYFFFGVFTYQLHMRLTQRGRFVATTGLIALGIAAVAGAGKPGLGQLFGFASTLMACAAAESTWLASLARRARWLGESTYGIYLLHFPIILVALLVVDVATPRNGTFFLLFAGCVVALARVSYVYFEQPCRKALRRLA